MNAIKGLSNTDFDNLIYDTMESVADNAAKAQRRMEALKAGTATTQGMDEEAVLRAYRSKLVVALAAIDSVLN